MTPTPEQIKAAHEALSAMCKNSYLSDRESMSHVVRAALPPLPETQRPRIAPARELMNAERPKWISDVYADSFDYGEQCIRAARAEIIAWLEWEIKNCSDIDCQGCYLRRRWIHELHSADTP